MISNIMKVMHTLIKKKVIFLAAALFLVFISGAEAATSTLTSIVVSPMVASIKDGYTQTFTAIPQDQDGVTMTDIAIAWLSSNNSVATINSSGTAAGITQGIATITAQSGNVSGTASLIVSSQPSSSTFSVSLTASPATGTAPFGGAILTARVSGTVTGAVSYTFYCNRPDERTDITTGYAHHASKISTTTYSTPFKVCASPYPDAYYTKVIAEQEGSVAQSGTTITVSSAAPPPTPVTVTPAPDASPTPSATPVSPPSGSILTNEQLRAEILRLLALIGQLQVQLSKFQTISVIPPGFEFKKDLKLGMFDQEVVYLKIILNKENCLTSKNTDYFGQGTLTGVKCFQVKYGIDIAGSVNQTTRDKLNELNMSY